MVLSCPITPFIPHVCPLHLRDHLVKCILVSRVVYDWLLVLLNLTQAWCALSCSCILSSIRGSSSCVKIRGHLRICGVSVRLRSRTLCGSQPPSSKELSYSVFQRHVPNSLRLLSFAVRLRRRGMHEDCGVSSRASLVSQKKVARIWPQGLDFNSFRLLSCAITAKDTEFSISTHKGLWCLPQMLSSLQA